MFNDFDGSIMEDSGVFGQIGGNLISLAPPADGKSLGDFAFRKAIRHLRCAERDGVAFWVDVVGYSSALAYGVLIPLFLVPKLQEVTLLCEVLSYVIISVIIVGRWHLLLAEDSNFD